MKQKLIDQLLHKASARFGAEGTDYSDFTSSKFAELIINECIDQVVGTKIVDPGAQHAQWNNALVIATMNVRDHFGVKE
jgi:hypothetical protein